jgi:hypothetical protein
LTRLENLGIDNCGIESVEPGAFNGLIMLIELSVVLNKISKIERGTFENLTTLERLYLRGNGIENLDPDTFLGLRNLRIIQLDSNKIEYFHPDLFVNAYNLESLSLSLNPLLEISTDRHFIYSPSLRHLDLSDCNISSISVATFSKVRNLNKLYLKDNHLDTINVNILKILPQLSEFLIYQNPLSCDCQLQQVWRWCQNHSITTGDIFGEPECDSPGEVHGMWWGTLQYSQCIDDRIAYQEGHKDYKDTDTDNDSRFFREFHQLEVYIEPSVQAVLFTFGTIGNVIVLVIIVLNKEMRTVPNMYIVNLAISDLIVLVAHVPLNHVYSYVRRNIIAGKLPDKAVLVMFFKFLCRFSVGLSAYLVALLSFQRYKVTVSPLHIHIHSTVTCRVTAATISGVWIVAAIFTLPSTLSIQESIREYFSAYNNRIYYEKVVLFELYVHCIVPLCVIVFFYVMTARHLVKSAHTTSEEIHPIAIRRKNTARIVLGLSIVFVISYVPYHIAWVYYILSGYKEETELLYTHYISTWLLLLNSCLDPVALFCCSLAFRTKLKRCIMCFRRRRLVTTTLQLAEFRRT